jgi:septal ring factor EnvC (AmiA/AmiB activator)
MANRSSSLGLLVVLTVATMHAQTPDRARIESASRRANERIRELQKEADGLVAQERTLLVELRRLEVDRDLKAAELERIEADLQSTSAELADIAAKLVPLEEAVMTERPQVEARLVELYKLGRPGYLRLLLNVQDVRSMGRAYRTVAALERLDRDRIARHAKTLDALRQTRATLEARQRRARVLQSAAQQARQALDRAVAARTAMVRSLDSRRDLNAQLAGELQVAHRNLQESLTQLASGRAAVATAALPLRPFRGDLAWPVNGNITARFGRDRRSPAATHRNGIEIAARAGTPVHAVHEGRVAYAEPFTGFSNLVIVDHGDQAYTLYGYLASVAVRAGTAIDGGDIVGVAGEGPSGQQAVYFELRIDGKAVNPVEWLRKNR